MDLGDVSPILMGDVIRMDKLAQRLERLLPALRGGAPNMGEVAAGVVDFGGPAAIFADGNADQTAARFEEARTRLLDVLRDPLTPRLAHAVRSSEKDEP